MPERRVVLEMNCKGCGSTQRWKDGGEGRERERERETERSVVVDMHEDNTDWSILVRLRHNFHCCSE